MSSCHAATSDAASRFCSSRPDACVVTMSGVPDTAVEMPKIELPKLKGKPARERYGVLKPIPPFKA